MNFLNQTKRNNKARTCSNVNNKTCQNYEKEKPDFSFPFKNKAVFNSTHPFIWLEFY